MANIKSQIKRNQQNEKARLRNKAVRSELKTRVKAAEAAAADRRRGRRPRPPAPRSSKIDRAAAKGVIHKNAAARKKSPPRQAAGASCQAAA